MAAPVLVSTLAREIWEGRGGEGGEGAWGGDTRKYSRTCMVTTTRERPPRISDRDFPSHLALRMEPLINATTTLKGLRLLNFNLL